MPGSDLNQKFLVATYYSRYLKKIQTLLLIENKLVMSQAYLNKHIPFIFLLELE
jgi:hypothetical protein